MPVSLWLIVLELRRDVCTEFKKVILFGVYLTLQQDIHFIVTIPKTYVIFLREANSNTQKFNETRKD